MAVTVFRGGRFLLPEGVRTGMAIVVRDGRIVERGKHRDLVHAGGTYQELYETQFSKAMET
jgi:ABC-type transport system involved in cytochrome bd biosynthesis fused ATPase/permease subunit